VPTSSNSNLFKVENDWYNIIENIKYLPLEYVEHLTFFDSIKPLLAKVMVNCKERLMVLL
jgi:hypothetical protein